MPGRRPIVVVGSINLDLVALAPRIPAIGETVTGTDFQIHPGGKGANQAVAIAKLGYPVRMIGRLGNDAFGVQLRSHLAETGVDTSGIGTSDGASGVALIVVSSKGENSIVVAPGANLTVTPQDVAANVPIIREAGAVLSQLEIPLDTVEYLSDICVREDIPLILDPAPAASLPQKLLKQADWFTPNESEAAFYRTQRDGDSRGEAPTAIADALLAQGCRGVILKMGSKGVFIASHEGLREHVPAFVVKAVDTTAAGDAFNGAFAVGLMLGKPPRESATFAAGVAAIAVTRAGAQPSMPTMVEVESFLNQYSAIHS
jgi:ribokinase